MVELAAFAVVGFLAYENWASISAWFASLATPAAASTVPAGSYYPNSPVPTSFSTNGIFVDSAGNQWAYSTQTDQWVIAVPAAAASTPAATPAPATTPATAPVTSAGTVVPVTQTPQVIYVIPQRANRQWIPSPGSPPVVAAQTNTATAAQ